MTNHSIDLRIPDPSLALLKRLDSWAQNDAAQITFAKVDDSRVELVNGSVEVVGDVYLKVGTPSDPPLEELADDLEMLHSLVAEESGQLVGTVTFHTYPPRRFHFTDGQMIFQQAEIMWQSVGEKAEAPKGGPVGFEEPTDLCGHCADPSSCCLIHNTHVDPHRNCVLP